MVAIELDRFLTQLLMSSMMLLIFLSALSRVILTQPLGHNPLKALQRRNEWANEVALMPNLKHDV